MDIKEEKIDELNAVLKVKVSPEDYESKVETTLKDYRKKANMPGFRPGKVPEGMIRKMYGKAVLVDEINKLLSNSLNSYITENKIEVLGNPLPKSDEETLIDWDNQKEFEFSYDLGLAPKFDVELSEKDVFPLYKVKIDDSLIDKFVDDIRKRYGKVVHPDTPGEEDILFGDFVELDTAGNILAGGILKSSSLAVSAIKDEALKKKLLGLKNEDKLVLKAAELKTPDINIAAILDIDKAQADELTADFQFTLKNVSRMEPSDLNQDFFDKVYGPDAVKSVEEFREKVNAELVSMFGNDSEKRLRNDIELALLKKLDLTLPDEFLKKWLKAVNDKPLTDEQIEAEYDGYSKSLKWQLVENKILKDNEIKVSSDEAIAHVKELVRQQYARYGQTEISEEDLDATAKRVLQNEDEAKKVFDELYDLKLRALFKDKFTIEEKEVSYDEFIKA